jgi:hypothetical protein
LAVIVTRHTSRIARPGIEAANLAGLATILYAVTVETAAVFLQTTGAVVIAGNAGRLPCSGIVAAYLFLLTTILLAVTVGMRAVFRFVALIVKFKSTLA